MSITKVINRKELTNLLLLISIKIYQHPLIAAIVLAVFSNIYLIIDYGIVNYSSLSMLWQISHPDAILASSSNTILAKLIVFISWITSLNYIDSSYLLMIITYTGIIFLVLLLAELLGFSLISQWVLIFLLLSHPVFNDFRSYIIIEPIFWFFWLLAIYILLKFYKQRIVLTIFLWLGIFSCLTALNIAAWFWLLLFPFGAILWRSWRRKSVVYALLSYAVIVAILMFLPIYDGVSLFYWFKKNIILNPQYLLDALQLNDNNWIKDSDRFISGIFIFSGVSSLILVRIIMSLGVAGVFLSIYAILKKQYKIINNDYLKIIVYIFIFDFLISVVLLVLSADSSAVFSFSIIFLLLLFAALGLSYVFKKIYYGRYSRLTILVIIWCVVAYIASGFIIFGPKQEYLKNAGIYFLSTNPNSIVYSNNSHFLFYADKNPNLILRKLAAENLAKKENFYYAYYKNRNLELPEFLQKLSPISRFSNSHGDQLLIYKMVNN